LLCIAGINKTCSSFSCTATTKKQFVISDRLLMIGSPSVKPRLYPIKVQQFFAFI
jgi:hypothetical protein